MKTKKYTHTSSDGMMWRMEGMRPVSALADMVIDEVIHKLHKKIERATGCKPKKRKSKSTSRKTGSSA